MQYARGIFLINWYGPRAGPFWPTGWPVGPADLAGRAVWGWRVEFLDPARVFLSGRRAGRSDSAHFDTPIGTSTLSLCPTFFV